MPHYADNSQSIRFLDEAVEGILGQNSDRWNLIIVDDASPYEPARSNLLRVAEQARGKINIIFRDSNGGAGVSRNQGIEWAAKHGCEIIAFNDADDVSHPKRVEHLLDLFGLHHEISVIYSTFSVIDEHGIKVPEQRLTESVREILESHMSDPPSGRNVWITIGTKTGYTNLTSATAVRLELACAQPFPNERVSEDGHTWMRYAAAGDEFFFDPEIPSLYRIPQYTNGSSVRSRVGPSYYAEKARVDFEGFMTAANIAIRRDTFDPSDLPELKARFFLRMAETMRREGEQRIFLDCMRRAESLRPEHIRKLH